MAKQSARRPDLKRAKPLPAAGSRRRGALAEPMPPGKATGRSDLRSLAAEVERLEGELAGMREQLRELEARADIDPLTNVFNRRGFDRELKRAVSYIARYGGSAALVYLDLDGFKPVNDRHGHAAGDAVLKAVAAALTNHVRASDIVARLGGDEFALLLWNLDERNAAAKATALETAIGAKTVPFGGEMLCVDVSTGVAMLGADEAAADVLARADAAMYARKKARRI